MKGVRTVFIGLIAALGVLGLTALVWEAWPSIENLLTSGYWRVFSRGKLLFTLSLGADLYLVMRLLRQGEGIERVCLTARKPLAVSPTLWKEALRLPSYRRIDVSRAYSREAMERLKTTYRFTAKWGHPAIGPLQVFSNLIPSSSVASLLVRLEVEPKGLQERIGHALAQELKASAGETSWSPTVKNILLKAYVAAQAARAEKVSSVHLLREVVAADRRIQEILFDLGVDLPKFENAIRWLEIHEELKRRWRTFRGAASRRPKGAMNRAMTAVETRMLSRFSDDLTLMAGRGYTELVVNRAREFEEIFRVLQGERKSVLLVGSPGVGKQAILDGIAERMVEEQNVPALLKDRRLAMLSIPKLAAGATPAEAQGRLLHCLADVGRAGNVVLAVPNVHEFGGGQGGGLDLAEVFSAEMSKGYFLAIATTTPEAYRAQIEGTSLGNAFVKVDIPEPDARTSIQILESKVGVIEYQSSVYFSYNALEKAVVLSDRYIKDRFLPEKAIDIAKEAAQYVRGHRGEKALVSAEDVAEIVSQKSHVPVTSVTASEADKLLHLEEIMHERLIGQDEAVKAVAAALRRARAELREQKRPIANFLFLGPTGVGKTETAKTVAEVYFGNEAAMVRVDMSEYQDKSAIYRLLGAPGEKGGLLTEPVRKNPFSLVLLDELEKAHPDILNIFLQIMDDGRVTDSAGRVVDFTNTIIIGTSNAGTAFIQEEIRKGTVVEEIKKALVERELKQYFRPEFLNRFDAVIVYKPLTELEIVQIARLVLAKVAKQLEAKGITFRATDEAIAELAHAGFDPLFGARPLRRVIQERVQDALANLLLTSKISRRDVVVLEKGGQLRVEKAEKL